MASTPRSILPPGLSPEARLLLACAGGQKDGTFQAVLEECLTGPFDWARLLRFSEFHQQHALLFHRLSPVFRDRIPSEVLECLRQEFTSNQWRNLNLIKELNRVLLLFSEHNIACIPFKGPLWAQSLYENLALRWIADLDLMIHPEDIQKAKELLLSFGYVPIEALNEKEEQLHLETDCEYEFTHPQLGVRVEIHWRFMPSHSTIYDTWSDNLWNRTSEVSLGRNRFRTLSPDDSFLYMVLHGGEKHQWASMRFLLDFVRVVNGAWPVDWSRVLIQAREINAMSSLAVALYLCEMLFDVNVPANVRKACPPEPDVQAKTALIRGRLFRDHFNLPGYREWLQYIRYHDTLNPGETVRISNGSAPWYYLKAISQPEFNDRAHLSDSLSRFPFSPYLARLFRLCGHHQANLLERLR